MTQQAETGYSQEPALCGAVLASMVSTMLAAAHVLMRSGLDATTVPDSLRVLSLTWLLINAPVTIQGCLPSQRRIRPLFSIGSLSLITLGAMAGLGWLYRKVGMTSNIAMWIPAWAGAALFAINFLRWLLDRRLAWTIIFLLYASLVGTAVAVMVYTNEFHHPLLLEELRQGRFPHNDTYFHAAAANIIDLHGISSTGLEGLVPLRYHVGSHWLLSLLGDLAGVTVFQAYLLVYPVLIVSWLLLAILTLAQCVLSSAKGRRNDLIYWLVTAIGLLGFLPLPVGLETYLCLNWTTTSESHAISTAVLLMVLSMVIRLYLVSKNANSFTVTDLLALFFVLPLTMAFLSFTKISIPMVMLPVAVFAFWRLRLYRHHAWTVSLGLILATCATIFVLLMGFAAGEQKSFPLSYVFYMVPRQWWGLFFPAMLLWVGWYLWVRFKQLNVQTLADLRSALRTRQLVDVELLVLVVIISSVPALLYTSFAVFFFWDYHRWIGLALLTGALGWMSRQQDQQSSLRLSSCFLVILLLCCLLTQGINAYLSFKQYTLEMVQGRAATPEQAKAWTEETHVAFRRFHFPQIIRLIRQAMASKPGPDRKLTLDFLVELNRLPRSERRQALVYIPKHNRDFWDHLPAGINRLFTCFLAPSLSGMPQLDGVPEYDPAFDYYYATAWNYLGFADYHLENHRPAQKPWQSDLPQLKKRVKEMGFRVLYIIDQDEKKEVILVKVMCE